MLNKQRGFTLVEIAIVLVIIGLLLGGVLKGQEMVTNAKIKRVAQDWNSVSAAILAYQDRFGQLPGDDTAADRHVGAPAADVGNGNGLIAGGWGSTNNTQESRLVWEHLRLSNLITGGNPTIYDQPRHVFGGVMGVQNTAYGMSGIVACNGNVVGDMSTLVDEKIDDGLGNTGTVRGGNAVVNYVPTGNYTLCSRI